MWKLIVDEVDVVTYEHFVIDRDAFADEGMTLDLTPSTNRRTALNLHERADARFVTYVAPVKVNEGEDLDISAQYYIRGDSLRVFDR